MTPEKIKASKPDGATHYNYRTETYYKEDSCGLYYWCDGWRPSWYIGSQFMIYIKPLAELAKCQQEVKKSRFSFGEDEACELGNSMIENYSRNSKL